MDKEEIIGKNVDIRNGIGQKSSGWPKCPARIFWHSFAVAEDAKDPEAQYLHQHYELRRRSPRQHERGFQDVADLEGQRWCEVLMFDSFVIKIRTE